MGKPPMHCLFACCLTQVFAPPAVSCPEGTFVTGFNITALTALREYEVPEPHGTGDDKARCPAAADSAALCSMLQLQLHH